MDVREKLVELILNADNDKNLGSYDLYELTHERTGLAEHFADYLIANGVTVQEWISVEDRLPELTEGTEAYKQSPCCLVTLQWWDGEMSESIGWYNQSGEWNEDSKNCKVVAWQPLPKAYQPKGE